MFTNHNEEHWLEGREARPKPDIGLEEAGEFTQADHDYLRRRQSHKLVKWLHQMKHKAIILWPRLFGWVP